jgi:hypothetical protein
MDPRDYCDWAIMAAVVLELGQEIRRRWPQKINYTWVVAVVLGIAIGVLCSPHGD